MARFKFTHYLIQETLYPAGYKKIETFKAWHYTKPIVKAGSKPKDHWVISLNSSRLGQTIQSEELGTWRKNSDGNQIRMTIGEPIEG
jgi:hypothetical protein